MTLYIFLKFLHVMLAITAVGANITYVGLMSLGAFGYTPILRRQIAALERLGPASAEYERLSGQNTRLGVFLAILVVVIVFLMVTKPALWG